MSDQCMDPSEDMRDNDSLIFQTITVEYNNVVDLKGEEKNI